MNEPECPCALCWTKRQVLDVGGRNVEDQRDELAVLSRVFGAAIVCFLIDRGITSASLALKDVPTLANLLDIHISDGDIVFEYTGV